MNTNRDKCPKCGSDLKWLAGAQAHDDNRYCSNSECGYEAWKTEPAIPVEGESIVCESCNGKGILPDYAGDYSSCMTCNGFGENRQPTELDINKYSQPLGDEFAKVLHDNLNSLYETDKPTELTDEAVEPEYFWFKGDEYTFDKDGIGDWAIDNDFITGDEFELEYSVTGTVKIKVEDDDYKIIETSPKYYTSPQPSDDKMREALEALVGSRTQAGWLGEILDNICTEELDKSQVQSLVANLRNAIESGTKALQQVKGKR